jgi:hypothetical protein
MAAFVTDLDFGVQYLLSIHLPFLFDVMNCRNIGQQLTR